MAEFSLQDIKNQAAAAAQELCQTAGLKEHDLVIVGCSSSEIADYGIGSHSSAEIGEAVFTGIYEVLSCRGMDLAAQCCEHLNRAVILEEGAAQRRGYETVNVVPQLKAGGSFATAAYGHLKHPVAAEEVKADAGIDIGGTLIGMHLKRVAVPVRTEIRYVGAAHVVCARTRPKFIGGERAHYDDRLK